MPVALIIAMIQAAAETAKALSALSDEAKKVANPADIAELEAAEANLKAAYDASVLERREALG